MTKREWNLAVAFAPLLLLIDLWQQRRIRKRWSKEIEPETIDVEYVEVDERKLNA